MTSHFMGYRYSCHRNGVWHFTLCAAVKQQGLFARTTVHSHDLVLDILVLVVWGLLRLDLSVQSSLALHLYSPFLASQVLGLSGCILHVA